MLSPRPVWPGALLPQAALPWGWPSRSCAPYTGSAAASSAPNRRQVLDPQAPRLSLPDQGSWRSPHPEALSRAVPPWGLGRGHTHASVSVLLSWAAGPVQPGDMMLADLRGQSPRAQTHTGTPSGPHPSSKSDQLGLQPSQRTHGGRGEAGTQTVRWGESAPPKTCCRAPLGRSVGLPPTYGPPGRRGWLWLPWRGQ